MSFVYRTLKGITDAIPVILRKIGSILLFFFIIGSIFGYYLALTHVSWIFILALFFALFVMWRDLDAGVLLLIIVIILALYFPNVLSFL